MGGSTASQECSKAMFELSESMEWTRLGQTLQIDHWAPLATPIPDELVKKKNWKKFFIRVAVTVATAITIASIKNFINDRGNFVAFFVGIFVGGFFCRFF